MTIFDPGNPEYWDEGSLLQEERRIFDVCHGCRLCFNICPSFPALFQVTDGVDGDLSKATAADFRRTEDLCYQCKLCYVRCPYTPPHDYNLDFPRVMMRSKLVRSRQEGVKWQDRLLGNTDL
ncbi:MAG: ferredoxin, partial [Dehalococcoidia bacterium]